jgi:predicted phage terminase large subunit-like protein
MSSRDDNVIVKGKVVEEGYRPSEEALKFIAFIRACDIEDNANPEIHYRLADRFFGTHKRVVIESFRGSSKSSLFEWFVLYIAVTGNVHNFGTVNFLAFVGDSAENGVKSFFRNLDTKIFRSDLLQKYLEVVRKTDGEMEIKNVEGKELLLKGYGMKALALDTVLYGRDGETTIRDCSVGDEIFGADGKLTKIIAKSEVFYKDTYEIILMDGRKIIVSGDHINSVVVREGKKHGTEGKVEYVDRDMTTKEIYDYGLVYKDSKKYKRKASGRAGGRTYNKMTKYTRNNYKFFIRNVAPMEYPERDTAIDPYVVGCTISQKIPDKYLRMSVEQRLALLQGIMDTKGTVMTNDNRERVKIHNNNKNLLLGVMKLVRSLGGKATLTNNSREFTYILEVWLNMVMFRDENRKKNHRLDKDTKVPIVCINKIKDKPTQCIAVDNECKQFIVDDYVRTHNTNIRGVRYKGYRPDMIVLDDVTTNEAMTSKIIQDTINDNFYKAIIPAMHPTKHRIYLIGTPISENDILHQTVNNPTWTVHKFPICEKFPCTKEEFKGNWEDRFPYEAVRELYEMYKASGQLQSFYLEYMLQLTDLSTLLVEEEDIKWFDPTIVYKNKEVYNFYISTDFAVSQQETADYSTIGVWAINSDGGWMLVDAICKRQSMDKTMEDLFRFVQIYNPLSVGIETTGQQLGSLDLIIKEGIRRNIYINVARKIGSKGSGSKGIRPTKDKLSRFIQGVQPRFKAGRVYLPRSEDLIGVNRDLYDAVEELKDELSKLTMAAGIKALKHDDMIDLLNMMSEMEIVAPSGTANYHLDKKTNSWIYDEDEEEEEYVSSCIF